MKKHAAGLAIAASLTLGVGSYAGFSSMPESTCNLERLSYAPDENLEAIDVLLIGRAKESIDFTAYVLTSVPIVEALDDAAVRGVRIRIYRDGADVRMPARLAAIYDRLVARSNVEVRYKSSPAPFMHLKAYLIDGKVLREGAGNFSHSGLLRQDNSLVVLRCPAAAERFQKQFDEMWRR